MKVLRKAKDEQGAIIIEAIIALTVYMFTIFTVLSIVDICYTQSRISIALNAAARDLSKYSYLYYKFGLDELQQEIEDEAGDSREMSEAVLQGTGSLITAFSDTATLPDDVDQYYEDTKNDLQELNEAGSSLSSDVKEMANAFADDPKSFLVGMGMMAANDAVDIGKNILAEAMARAFMQKNLKAFEGDNPDSFLSRHHVVDGMDGLNFEGSSMMAGGQDDEIILTVTYEIEVIKLLDMEHTFKIRQTAKTYAWGNGVSNEASTE